MSDTDLREQIASVFTDEGEGFEKKLDTIMALVARREALARKETVLHFRKVAQYEKDRGWGCERIIGETDIMAKNAWRPTDE